MLSCESGYENLDHEAEDPDDLSPERVDRLGKKKRSGYVEQTPTPKRQRTGGGDSMSLPTPWKMTCIEDGPFLVAKQERIIREQRFEIVFNAPLLTFHAIQRRMSERGFKLGYKMLGGLESSRSSILSRHCIVVSPELSENFPQILQCLKADISVQPWSA